MVIDEAAFAKNGDNRSDDSLMAIWEKALKPTLIDFAGEVLVCSNSAGKNPDNFFFNICTDPQYGFKEFHATTLDNPLLPKRLLNESLKDWATRRVQFLDDLKRDNDPLVYAQEYLAEFVDWSGAAFFSREKLLVDNLPVTILPRCEYVYAVIDTASKTGTDHDATAVTFFALDRMTGNPRPIILDWDIAQIEGGVLEHWLPSVFLTLEELARLSHTRLGSAGAFIEDKNSGTILLQQAARRGMPARAIESKLTAMGKDELRSRATFTARWSNTATAPSTRRSSTSNDRKTICSTRSKVFGSATKTATAKTTSSTPSATGSRWAWGIERVFETSWLGYARDRRRQKLAGAPSV